MLKCFFVVLVVRSQFDVFLKMSRGERGMIIDQLIDHIVRHFPVQRLHVNLADQIQILVRKWQHLLLLLLLLTIWRLDSAFNTGANA